MARSEAYDRYPEHVLAFDEAPARLRVRCGDVLIAKTERGLRLREGSYPPVVYVPREDVRMDRLGRSSHVTHCPFKGDAHYFDFTGGDDSTDGAPSVVRVAWSYEDPFDQMEAIRGHLAFYADRVDVEEPAWQGSKAPRRGRPPHAASDA